METIGFKVQNLKNTLASLEGAGYRPLPSSSGTTAYVLAPDGVRVQLSANVPARLSGLWDAGCRPVVVDTPSKVVAAETNDRHLQRPDAPCFHVGTPPETVDRTRSALSAMRKESFELFAICRQREQILLPFGRACIHCSSLEAAAAFPVEIRANGFVDSGAVLC